MRAHRDSTGISRMIGTSAFSARTAFSVTTAAFGVGTIVGLRLTGGFTHAPCFSWAAILTWEISRMVAIECC